MYKKLIFILFFVILGFVALQIPVNQLAGSKVKFTLFDLFGPISGAFLGTWVGMISVSAMQLTNLFVNNFMGINHSSFLTLIATSRLLPPLVAVYYFAKADKKVLLVCLLSMLVFVAHPIGRSVWYYSLFWVIPVLVWPYRERFLVLRALGATFAAHAVGGAMWIWAFNLSAPVWNSLIPTVILERSLFAVGIAASYILVNNVLAYLSFKKFLPEGILYNKKHILKF